MKWNNLTPEEAQGEYDEAKSRYLNSAEEYSRLKGDTENARADYYHAQNQYYAARSEKLNFEKRIKEIEKIISSLEGKGGLFSADVPSAINQCNEKISKANESMASCIRCDSITSPDLTSAFHCPTVEEESNSAAALQAFKVNEFRRSKYIDRQISVTCTKRRIRSAQIQC